MPGLHLLWRRESHSLRLSGLRQRAGRSQQHVMALLMLLPHGMLWLL